MMLSLLTQKKIGLAVACALALGAFANLATAQTRPEDTGYLTDQRGKVVKSGFELCWHTGFGPPVAMAGCGESTFVPPELAEATPEAPAPKPQPANERVSLDADALFDFNKAVLRPAGQAALDDFVSKTRDISPEVITAVGHADRFGSLSYNQRLSEKRAAAVKSYLLSKGIAANRIHTEGKGETQPLTKAGECDGAKSTKVIACLQPDRRVEIEIVGTRIAR